MSSSKISCDNYPFSWWCLLTAACLVLMATSTAPLPHIRPRLALKQSALSQQWACYLDAQAPSNKLMIHPFCLQTPKRLFPRKLFFALESNEAGQVEEKLALPEFAGSLLTPLNERSDIHHLPTCWLWLLVAVLHQASWLRAS